MSVKVKEGAEVDFSTMKSGETNGREWAYYFALDEKPESKKKMLVFIENADKAKNWSGKGSVKKILSVEMKPRKNEATGKWEDTYSVTVEVEGHDANARAQASNTFSRGVDEGFMDMPNEEDFDNIFK